MKGISSSFINKSSKINPKTKMKMPKKLGVGLEIQYKGCPMASYVFNIVYTEHLPAFRQIC